jgi:chromosome segregation ATPase
MFLAGLLTAHLPWRRKKRHSAIQVRESEELCRENKRLASALAHCHPEPVVAEIKEKLAERTEERDRERAARSEAEDALRRLEQESHPVKSRELCDLEDQRYQMQCDELNRQLRDKKSEFAAVLEERDTMQTWLEEERHLRKSTEAAQQAAEEQLLRMQSELADALTKYEEDRTEKERRLREQESELRRARQDLDVAHAELRDEHVAREGIQHLLDQRCQDVARLTAELAEAVDEREQQVSEWTQRVRDRDTSIAEIERDRLELQLHLASEAAARQSAELAYRELLGENQRVMREIEKADALLEQRLFLAKRLEEREGRLHSLEAENESLRRELDNLVEHAASYDKEKILDQILRIHRPTPQVEPPADQLSRRSA